MSPPVAEPAVDQARILVIDDKFISRLQFTRFLEDSYRVSTVRSGREALAFLGKNRVDLILLDIILESKPEGLELLRLLKSDERTKDIPIVTITGNAGKEEMKRSIEYGAATCLEKTVDHNFFRATVGRLIHDAGRGKRPAAKTLSPWILHVEDDDAWADLVRLWLVDKGFTMQRAASRREMRTSLADCGELPSCIIMDIGLDGADGLDLCKEIKNDPLLQRIPIVLFTYQRNKRLLGFECQALHFVPKPSEPSKSGKTEKELLAVLGTVLSQQERTLGIFDKDDLKLDPQNRQVYREDKLLATLAPGLFAGFHQLLLRSPKPVPENQLHAVFLERPRYKMKLPDGHCRTVKTYISTLRGLLGKEVGPRIRKEPDRSYAYIGPNHKKRLS